jgi:glycosyltransferase involved in cell wall biosynthesis
MRICVDATSLLFRSAGVKNYVYHWLHSLNAVAPEHEILAFPMLDDLGTLNHQGSNLSFWRTLPRIALLQMCKVRWFPLIDAVVKADVLHASNQIRNVPRGMKLTATLYDMTVALFPEYHTHRNRREEYGFQEVILKRADGLIAISESAKNDATRLLHIDPNRIEVIYPGIDQRFFSAEPLKRPKPYILFVGTVEPRKNIDALLDGWDALPQSLREHHELIIAGPIGWAGQSTIRRITSGVQGVQYFGYVAEDDLFSLTAGASVFVYPSLYEGFGLPPVQAMAAGVPVVTSDVSSLPEVVGEAGVLVNPNEPSEIGNAIQNLLLSPSLRAALGEKGRNRARQFTWENSARKSVDFFERL